MIRNKAELKIEYSKGAKKYNPDDDYHSDSPNEEEIVPILIVYPTVRKNLTSST